MAELIQNIPPSRLLGGNVSGASSRTTNTQAQQQAGLRNEIDKYIQGKIQEGYTKDVNGNLVKTVGNTVTTIRIDYNTGNVDISERQTTTKQVKKVTGEFEQIQGQIKKVNRTLNKIDSGEITATPNTRAILETRLRQLYEARDNLENTGTAYITESVPVKVEEKTTRDKVVKPAISQRIIEGQNYKYDYVPIDEFKPTPNRDIQTKTIKQQQEEQAKGMLKGFDVTKLTTERKQQEEESITPLQYEVKLKGEQEAQAQAKAERIQYYNTKVESLREKGQGEYMNTLKGAGLLTTYTAIKFVEGGVSAVQVVSPVDFKGNLQVPIITPTYQFGKYLASGEYISDIKANPLGTTASFAGATVALTRTPLRQVAQAETQAIIYPIVNTPRFTSADVKASTYKYGRTSERARIFTTTEKIKEASTQYQFIPIQQLGTNKATTETQYNLIGLETPIKKVGKLPLETKEVGVYEENPIIIEQIGKNARGGLEVRGTTTSRVIDKPVVKSQDVNFIEGEVKGFNTEYDTLVIEKDITPTVRQNIKQTELGQYGYTTLFKKNVIYKYDKQASKPLIYDTPKPETKKVLPDNSLIYETTTENPIIETSRTSSGKVEMLKVSTDYEYNPITQEYTRKVTGTNIELNKDIQGFNSKGQLKSTPILKPQFKLDVKQLNTQVQEQQPRRVNIIDTRIDTKQGQEPIQDTQTRTRQIVTPITRIGTVTDTQTRTRQEQVRYTPQRQTPITPAITTRQGKITTKVPPPINTPKPQFSQQVFTTKVKTQGKFKTIGTFSSMSEAFNRGKQFVQQTASATFKVESGSNTVKPQGFLPKGFTTSKSVAGGIVQQRGYRIQSQGEKLEITAKGRAVKRARFKFNTMRGKR